MNRNKICIVLIDANLLKGENIYLDESSTNFDDIFYSDDIDKIDQSNSSTCCLSNPFSKVEKELVNDSMNNFDRLVELNIIKVSKNSYCGHFIVLIGYDDLKRVVFYRNPASSSNFSFTSYLNFEIARKSFGTDQDILFIHPD